MTDHRRTIAVLWIALCGALAASFAHLATLFYRYEPPGTLGVGVAILGAAAVDLGVLASMRTIGERAAVGASTRNARIVVAMLVALSMAANAAHALALGNPASVWELWLAIGAAAALPLIVLGLAVLLDELRRPAAVASARDSAAVVASAGRVTSDTRRAKNAAQRPVQPASDVRAAAVATLMASGLSKSQAYRRTREAAAVDVALAASRNGNGHGEVGQ